MRRDRIAVSLLCTIIAGTIFLSAILFSEELYQKSRVFVTLYILLGIVLDWLPFFAGWMGERNISWRRIKEAPFWIKIHFLFGVIAYAHLLAWMTFWFSKTTILIFFILWVIANISASIHVILMVRRKD